MTQIKLKNLIICENVSVSSDGKWSAFNVFSEIKSGGFPAIQPRMNIVSIVTGENGSYNEKIEIISPDNLPIISIEKEININGPDGSGFMANLINTSFPKEGKYWVQVSINGKVITDGDENHILLKKM